MHTHCVVLNSSQRYFVGYNSIILHKYVLLFVCLFCFCTCGWLADDLPLLQLYVQKGWLHWTLCLYFVNLFNSIFHERMLDLHRSICDVFIIIGVSYLTSFECTYLHRHVDNDCPTKGIIDAFVRTWPNLLWFRKWAIQFLMRVLPIHNNIYFILEGIPYKPLVCNIPCRFKNKNWGLQRLMGSKMFAEKGSFSFTEWSPVQSFPWPKWMQQILLIVLMWVHGNNECEFL